MFIFRGPSVPNMWLRHYVSIGIGQIQEQAKIDAACRAVWRANDRRRRSFHEPSNLLSAWLGAKLETVIPRAVRLSAEGLAIPNFVFLLPHG